MMTETNERSIYGLRVLKNSHKEIRRLRRQTGNASLHGNKFWMSASLLIDYLSEHQFRKGLKVLELGCGWGISGLYCASAFQSEVTALDADATVFPFLELHAELNGVSIRPWQARYESLTKAKLAQFDMIIASDICFWDELSKPLYNLIRRALSAGVERIIMADPGRPPFRNMAELCDEKIADVIYDNWSVPHPYNTSGLILDIGA